FLLSVGLVRTYSVAEYAAYGMALSIALTLQAVQRGFTIQASLLTNERFASRAGTLLAGHLIILGIALATSLVVCVGLLLLSAGTFAINTAAATVACIAVFFQLDVNRILLIKRNRQSVSLAVSVSVVLAYAAVILLGHARLATFATSMLMLAALSVATSALLVWRGIRPQWRAGLVELARDARDVFAWTTLGSLAAGTYMHTPLFILGAVQPPLQAAGFVMTRNLMQPLGVIMRSFDVVDKHLFATRPPGGGSLVRLSIARNLLVAVAVAGPIGLAAAPLLGLVYGQPAVAFADVLRLWVPAFALAAATLPLEIVVFSRGLARPYAFVAVTCGAVTLVATYPLVVHLGASGAVSACLVGYSLQIIGAAVLVTRTAPVTATAPVVARPIHSLDGTG
ncbi:MAG TPA: hypothetical protein VK281_17615, partial [Xanthobacteraceae bacterium]|nr:hypothetical protein [Xanthobacteraceae bacterium]